MLGEKVGELQASTTTKALPAEGSNPRFETTVEGSGTLLGVEINWLATYWAEMNADGTLYGECPNQGVIISGDGIGTFRANGSGRFTEEGGAYFRGSAFFRTSSPSLANLSRFQVVDQERSLAPKAVSPCPKQFEPSS